MATDTSLLRTGHGSADDVLIREYQHGDDVRRVHWRSTARTGALMVRREERSWDPSATVLIDNRASAYSRHTPDDRLEWVVSAAASIAIHLLADGFDVNIVEADGTVLSPHRAMSGRESLVLEQLADLKTSTVPTLGEAFAASARGAEGQLLIAILGRVDEGDAACLHPGPPPGTLLLGTARRGDAATGAQRRRPGARHRLALRHRRSGRARRRSLADVQRW